MILVDTSIMIDYLKGAQTDAAAKLEDILERRIPFGICPQVYRELLQGAKDAAEYDRLKDYLDTQKFYFAEKGLESYAEAALKYVICRQNGLTVRSANDLMIAQIAIENNVMLFHSDKDFDAIAGIIMELKIY
jgi:predicted nucleic acid-binding protein